MDAIKAIGGLVLICFGVWLFVKLVFHPMLFELDADTIEWAKRNQGVLIKHWYGEIDDPQLVFAIENQHRREVGVSPATWGL